MVSLYTGDGDGLTVVVRCQTWLRGKASSFFIVTCSIYVKICVYYPPIIFKIALQLHPLISTAYVI